MSANERDFLSFLNSLPRGGVAPADNTRTAPPPAPYRPTIGAQRAGNMPAPRGSAAELNPQHSVTPTDVANLLPPVAAAKLGYRAGGALDRGDADGALRATLSAALLAAPAGKLDEMLGPFGRKLLAGAREDAAPASTAVMQDARPLTFKQGFVSPTDYGVYSRRGSARLSDAAFARGEGPQRAVSNAAVVPDTKPPVMHGPLYGLGERQERRGAGGLFGEDYTGPERRGTVSDSVASTAMRLAEPTAVGSARAVIWDNPYGGMLERLSDADLAKVHAELEQRYNAAREGTMQHTVLHRDLLDTRNEIAARQR